MELIHCVYCSASTIGEFTRAALDALLEKARRNNTQLEVTGMLLYQSGSFIQVLEGDRPVVEALLAKIATDKRHDRIMKIIIEPIKERDFGAWTMGFPKVTKSDMATIPGLNDFFIQGRSYCELGEGRARTLLSAFTEGKWRTSLS